MTKSDNRIVTIMDVTDTVYKKLHNQYASTLLCPCRKDTIEYRLFTSHHIRYHPLCSSIFVSWNWIQALYFPDASWYGATDFRTIAFAQVKQRFETMLREHHGFLLVRASVEFMSAFERDHRWCVMGSEQQRLCDGLSPSWQTCSAGSEENNGVFSKQCLRSTIFLFELSQGH